MQKRNIIISLAILLAACIPSFAVPLQSEAIIKATAVEDAFAEVIQAAKPAVVTIANKQTPKAKYFGQGDNPFGEFFPDEWFERFFGMPREERQQRPRKPQQPENQPPQKVGMGSGVIISKDGYIVTNYHVIENFEFLEVRTADGKVYDSEYNKEEVKLVGCDKDTDIAILKIESKEELPFLEFADSDKIRVGQWAIAIGAPFNLDNSITIGCVSQKGRYGMGMANYDDYIQTDASINPGNSGGPLLSIRGEIIGINQFIVTGGASRGSVGIGFAIASNLVRQISDSLVKNGKIERAFLGISMQELPKNFGVESGVLVREVVDDSAAEKAGIKSGDVICSINGEAVKSSHDLLMLVAKYQPKDILKLKVIRNGEEMEIEVKAGKRTAGNDEQESEGQDGDDKKESNEISIRKLGLKLQEQNGKVIVASVTPDGAVAKSRDNNEPMDQVKAGDIIVSVNGKEVNDVDDVKDALKTPAKNNKVILYMERKLPSNQAPYHFFVAITVE